MVMVIMDDTIVENVDSDGNHLGVVLIVWQASPSLLPSNPRHPGNRR